MKFILILVLLMTAHCHAGWFHDDDLLWQQYQQQLAAERQSTGGWEIIAGVLAIGGVILFTVGAALGSKARRDGKR